MAELMLRWIERDKKAAGKLASSRVQEIFATEEPKAAKPKKKKTGAKNEESTEG